MNWPAISPSSLTDSSTKSPQTMEFSRLRNPSAPTCIQTLVSTSESPPPYSTVPTDAIPLYISDLSKPFPPFNQLDGEHSLAWKRQLDELDALWGDVASGEGNQGRLGAQILPSSVVTAGLSAHNMVANPPIFAATSIESNDLMVNSRGPGLSTFPPCKWLFFSPRIVDFERTISADTYSSDPESNLQLGIQDATLWSDFPMGHR
jgi:hypothetical protein